VSAEVAGWNEARLLVQPTFQPGVSLSLFAGVVPDSGWPRPMGPALATQVVDANGYVTFTGLVEGTEYACGRVDGQGHWTFLSFTTDERDADQRELEALEAKSDNRSSAALEEFGEGVGLGNATADTTALGVALTELASGGTQPFTRRLILGDKTYRIDQPQVASAPLVIEGKSSYGSRLLIDDAFPEGGTLFTATSVGAPEGLLHEESHVPGWGLRHLCIDGNGRHVKANAMRFQKVDRGQYEDVMVRNLNGSVITGASLRESQFWAFRTWLCGNSTSPVLNFWDDGTGGTDGHNLLSFTGCQIMLSCGDHLLAGTDAPGGQIVRGLFFNSVVFHGLIEYFEAYADNYGHNGDHAIDLSDVTAQCRHVIKNARSIVYDGGCRFNLPGRGLPIFSLQGKRARRLDDQRGRGRAERPHDSPRLYGP
jgi:hypothetical protein